MNYQGIQNFRDIKLSQQAVMDASGKGGGNIQIQLIPIRYEDALNY
ncbi:MAG: hypothetical protein V7K40_17115 [Nostoc sp.]